MDRMNILKPGPSPEQTKPEQEFEQVRQVGEYVRWDMKDTYGVSTVSESPKFTDMVSVCTVAVVSGISEKTGKRVSFMSHGLPVLTVPNKYWPDKHPNHERYWDLVRKGVRDLIKEVNPETIEISLFGGLLHESRSDDHGESTVASVIETGKRIRNQVNEMTGVFVNPVVMSMPNTKIYSQQLISDDSVVAYDTPNDRFFTKRTKADQAEYEWEPVTFSNYISALRKLHTSTIEKKY